MALTDQLSPTPWLLLLAERSAWHFGQRIACAGIVVVQNRHCLVSPEKKAAARPNGPARTPSPNNRADDGAKFTAEYDGQPPAFDF
jgi:hypothetical protein